MSKAPVFNEKDHATAIRNLYLVTLCNSFAEYAHWSFVFFQASKLAFNESEMILFWMVAPAVTSILATLLFTVLAKKSMSGQGLVGLGVALRMIAVLMSRYFDRGVGWLYVCNGVMGCFAVFYWIPFNTMWVDYAAAKTLASVAEAETVGLMKQSPAESDSSAAASCSNGELPSVVLPVADEAALSPSKGAGKGKSSQGRSIGAIFMMFGISGAVFPPLGSGIIEWQSFDTLAIVVSVLLVIGSCLMWFGGQHRPVSFDSINALRGGCRQQLWVMPFLEGIHQGVNGTCLFLGTLRVTSSAVSFGVFLSCLSAMSGLYCLYSGRRSDNSAQKQRNVLRLNGTMLAVMLVCSFFSITYSSSFVLWGFSMGMGAFFLSPFSSALFLNLVGAAGRLNMNYGDTILLREIAFCVARPMGAMLVLVLHWAEQPFVALLVSASCMLTLAHYSAYVVDRQQQSLQDQKAAAATSSLESSLPSVNAAKETGRKEEEVSTTTTTAIRSSLEGSHWASRANRTSAGIVVEDIIVQTVQSKPMAPHMTRGGINGVNG